jgi:hypothetical protein
MDKHRTIVEGPEFTTERRALDIDCRRIDEILEGVCEVLARKPDEFPTVANTPLRRVRTRPFKPDVPSYGILFEYDADTVTLRYIYRIDVLD